MDYSIGFELYNKDDLEAKDNDSRAGTVKTFGIDMKKPPRGKFVPSPVEEDLGLGVVHLYRGKDDIEDDRSTKIDGEDGTILAIVAVPSYLTPSDFLGFVAEGTKQSVSHFRMIRTAAKNRYMVLMKFYDKAKADAFYDSYNGKLFNSMEAESCHVVHVRSIFFQSQISPPATFSFLLDDPFMPSLSKSIDTQKTTAVAAKPAPPRTPALQELPTCVVCLERMDASVTGLLTILCQHSFHCACLRKWSDSSCPVCRYSQKRETSNEDGVEPMCATCSSLENLWACLICGNIGCGRYDEGHAQTHYLKSKHCYAMDIQSQRVWDYAADGYVHRLIQDKTDGKMVELPASLANGQIGSQDDAVSREKLDDMGIEYAHLLSSQLDSQRFYFEDKVAAAADKAMQAAERAETLCKTLEALRASYKTLVKENEHLKNALPKLERSRGEQERKMTKMKDITSHLQKELGDETSMNTNLLQKVQKLSQQKGDLEVKVNEVEEQLRDMFVHFEALSKLEGTEAEGGSAQAVCRPQTKTHRRNLVRQ